MTNKSYSSYQAWKDWKSEKFGTYSEEAAAYFSDELSKSGVNELSKLHILEIGFGNGEFAGWCKKKGAKYSGTEIIPELILRGSEAGFNVFSSLDPLITVPDSVDVLVAIDVFEHFEINLLRALISKATVFLRPGGLIIARVPSGDSPFARAIQYGDLTHQTILGSSAIRQLAEDVSLQVVQLREPCFLYKGLGVHTFLRRLFVQICRRIIFSILIKFCMGGGSVILTPNMVFVLKKPIV